MKNEILITGNKINNLSNIINVAKGTVKINVNNGLASGFFLKLEGNNKPFYCLMTNEHVITEEKINNKDEITIQYNNEKNNLSIKLDNKERKIFHFKDFKIDITSIEIIPKDKINKDYFLMPNYKIDINNYNNLKKLENKCIQVIQYPKGGNISHSEGKIIHIFEEYNHVFSHDASTLDGSSGSPIVLKDEDTVIGIHTGGNPKKTKNYGMFIGFVFESVKAYKKNGECIEYYENGNKKYEGNFGDDKYNGKGILYYENGNKKYEGNFKNDK